MRKLFWVCLAGAVMLFAGVFTMAQIAFRHPQSFCGRALFGVSYAVATLNPLHAMSPLAARLEELRNSQDQCEVAGTAEESTAVDEEKPTPFAVDAPIVIAEDDNLLRTSPDVAQPSLQPPAPPAPEQPVSLVQDSELFRPEVECPPSTAAQTSPAVMPYASEEDCEAPSCERLHMPTIAGCEPLAMPSAEEEQEEDEVSSNCPTGGAEKLLRLFGQMMKKSGEEPSCPTPAPTPDCREDSHYHHHYPACPATGRSYYPCPPAEPEKPAVGGEEPSEDGSKAALKKIRSYKARKVDGESCPIHPRVDTLEMRPEDRQLYDYGPGVL
jgi:hypothetical protein